MGAGLFDILGVFSDAQAIAAAAASTNTIDLLQVAPKIGVGPHAPMLDITVNSINAQTADTISIELQQCDDDGAGSPDGSWETVFMPLSGAAGAEVACTDARLSTAGAKVYQAALPYQVNKRHIRLYYNNTTSNGSISFDAVLTPASASLFRQSQVVKSNVTAPS